jgi:microcystin-dependent protein
VFTATEANQANELVSKYTVNGDIVVHGSSGLKTIPTGGSGNNNKVLVADSTVADGGVKWAQINADGIATGAVTSDKILNNTIALGDLATALQAFLVPVGTIAMYAGASAPTGWLLCDGTTSTSGYTALAAIVGGTTPDLRGRVPVGAGTGTDLTARSLGATGGAETHTLTEAQMPVHTHIQNAHAHDFAGKFGGSSAAGINVDFGGPGNEYGVGGGYVQTATATNQNAGSGAAHNNMQPFRVVNYIIKHD